MTVAAEGLADHVIMVEKDDEVAAVWTVLIDGDDDEVERLCTFITDFELTESEVHRVLDEASDDRAGKAFQTIVRNRCSRGGIMAPGAGLVKSGENGRGLSSRWYPQTLVKRIWGIREHRDTITLIHGDGLQVMASYPDAAMLIDPPYTAGGKRAGSRLYTHSVVDHELLFRLAGESRGPVMLTYDDSTEVREMAAEQGLVIGEVEMKSSHHARIRELIITSA